MAFSFIGQPLPGSPQIGGVLGSALGDEQSSRAWFLAAWGKQSGLSRLASELRGFRDRGGSAKAVLGLDEGGATVEGLKLAIDLFDEAWVFHDAGARTFHPKLYVVEGDGNAQLVLGSGNLTKGGLFTNYEAAVHFDLSTESEQHRQFLASAKSYFEFFTGSDRCFRLDAGLIERLKSDPGVLLVSERRANAKRARRRKAEGAESVFGAAAIGDLLGAPAPSVAPISEDADDDDDALPAEVEEDAAGPSAPGERGPPAISGFFKALSANDVSLKDSPGQIIIPIAFLPFFGELEVQKDEKSSGGPRQSHREFPLTYRRDGTEKQVPTGRVILYEPATFHKRPNNEVRFTFRDRQILESLRKDDVLVFQRQDGAILVEHRPAGWRPDGVGSGKRFGLI